MREAARRPAALSDDVPGRRGVIVVCGPDGSGKTTLVELVRGLVPGSTPMAAKRGLQRAGALPRRRVRGDTAQPHRAEPYGLAVSLAKLVYLWLDTLTGWLAHVRPAARTSPVVIERGWWDHAVDPVRYRLEPASTWFARALGYLLPLPDLVLVCEAPADVVSGRKDELPATEIVRQSHAWRRVVPRHVRRVFIDTSGSIEDTSRQLRAALGSAPAPRPAPRAEVRAVRDRSATWLPLLRALHADVPEAFVWKNADPALAGIGDIDLAAPRRTWERVELAFRRWATALDLPVVVACRHLPHAMFLIALEPGGGLLQLDVRDRVTFAGATIFTADGIRGLAIDDERGFRTVRPGVEGTLKLFANGSSRTGGSRPDRLERERVRDLLRSDPEGAWACAPLLGAGVLRATEAAARGGWDRPAVLAVLARALGRTASDPAGAVRQVRARASERCDVAGPGRSLAAGDPGAWLARVRATHMVHGELW